MYIYIYQMSHVIKSYIITWNESKYTKNLSEKLIPKIFIVYDEGIFLKNKYKVEAIIAYGPDGITDLIFNACVIIM